MILATTSTPRRSRRASSQRKPRRARAADLDAPVNSTSFHLRVLANAGLLEEDPEHARDKRDRVWKVTEGAWSVGSPEHPVEDELLGSALVSQLADDTI